MYEDYLTKALVGIINAKQALNNFEQTNIKDLKNTAAYNVQQAIEYLLKYCIYNCEKYISSSIESILNQTYSNLELILIDDGSTDNSYRICCDYREKDKRKTNVR